MHKNTEYANKKAFSFLLNACKKLERVKGFEPSTHGLGSRYSTTELHPLELYRNKVGFLVPTDFIIAHEA